MGWKDMGSFVSLRETWLQIETNVRSLVFYCLTLHLTRVSGGISSRKCLITSDHFSSWFSR